MNGSHRAVPRKIPGTRNVSRQLTVAVTASRPESQYAAPRRDSTGRQRFPAGTGDWL